MLPLSLLKRKQRRPVNLEPIPKTDGIMACFHHCSNVSRSTYQQQKQPKKDEHTITKIPDRLWNEISPILPTEKQNKTIGWPIVPFGKVMDGIMYILRTGCQWKMLPGEYGSGSTCHRRFQEWVQLDIFRKIWVRLLELYDDKEGVKWTWQSPDSISIKSPLGGQ